MNSLWPGPDPSSPSGTDYPVPEEIEAAQGAIPEAILIAYCVGRPACLPEEAQLLVITPAWLP